MMYIQLVFAPIEPRLDGRFRLKFYRGLSRVVGREYCPARTVGEIRSIDKAPDQVADGLTG